MNNHLKTALALVLMFLGLTAAAEARTVTIMWDPVPESNVVGYIVYYGTAPRQYTSSIRVGNVTAYNFVEPVANRVYYFAVQAVNSIGAGGPLSVEVSSTNIPVGNFDGDGRTDFAIFRPSSGYWQIRTSLTGAQFSVAWGQAGDIPFSGDVDGDGKGDLTVFRPSTGYWSTLFSSTDYNPAAAQSVAWGISTDVPFMADFDGDGTQDYGIYRPSAGYWFIRFANGGSVSFAWGTNGDIPAAGDFDGDGRADLCVFRPNEGRWYISYSSYGYPRSGVGATWIGWGTTGDRPHVGDFNGDGVSDIAIWRPSSGYWFARFTSLNGLPSSGVTVAWGGAGDESMVGDWDGDGRTDLGVFRPSEGRWFVLNSSTGFTAGTWFAWGLTGDIPLVK